jgi:hypothetical protein
MARRVSIKRGLADQAAGETAIAASTVMHFMLWAPHRAGDIVIFSAPQNRSVAR